jgi:hypothetical protein
MTSIERGFAETKRKTIDLAQSTFVPDDFWKIDKHFNRLDLQCGQPGRRVSFRAFRIPEEHRGEIVNSFQRFQEKMKLNSAEELATKCWMSEACSCEGEAEGSYGAKFPGPLFMVIHSNCALLLYMNHGLRPAPLTELNLADPGARSGP